HKKELKDQIINAKASDSSYMQKILSKVFKHGNVSIKDNDLKDVLSDYISSSSSSSSSK
ncbi:MAG: peptidylprolyl isomerase, partial [Ligilactobacillus ruminis]|nr:peptidylprolyl isomerase [Ligilactobacillus ruminis]